MLLIGSRHRCQSCSEATRFARSGASQSTQRSTSTSRTPLLGFIDHLSVDTTVLRPHPVQAVAWTSLRDCHVPNVFRSCRSSRLQRFPPQRSDPKIRSFDGPRVCCTPQPTMGFTKFRTPWNGLSTEPRPEGRWTRRSVGSPPLWRRPYEAFPSSAAWPCRHRATPFRMRSRSPTGVPSRRSSRARYRVATVRFSARRPQGFLPPRSPLRARDVAAARPLDAPLGFGSTRSDAAARFAPPDLVIGRFAWRPSRFGVPRPERREKAMEFRPCLAPCDRYAVVPEGSTAIDRVGSGVSRRRHLGRIPDPEGLWDASGSTPRGGSTASVRAPEGEGLPTSSRRISEETRTRPSARSEERRPVVRARARHPSAVARVHDGETARRGRLHPKVCASARHSRAPRRRRRRTQQAKSRRTRPWARPEAHPKVCPCGLVAPASPASWRAGSGQTVIVFTGTAAARSGDRVAPSIRRSESRRRSAEGAVGAAQPTCGGDPPRAPKCSRRDGPESIPGSPDRGRVCFRSVGAEALPEPRPV